MSRSRCSFCDHQNPVGSRFCNDCGSPLYLAPCPSCESLNDEAARVCHHCGAALVERAGDAAVVGAHPPGASGSSANTVAATQSLAPAGTAPPVFRDEMPPHVPETLAAALAPHSGRVEQLLPAGSRPLSRAAVAGRAPRARSAPLVVLLAAALALLAYFAYRPPVSLNERLASVQLALLGAVYAHTPPARPAPRPAEPTSALPPVAADAPADPSASDTATRPPHAVERAGEQPAGAAAEATDATASTRSATDVQPDAPVLTTPPPQAAAATRAPSPESSTTNPAAGLRTAAAPRHADRARAKRAAPSLERATPPEPSQPRVPVDVPARAQPGPCTRAVAALGLCNIGEER